MPRWALIFSIEWSTNFSIFEFTNRNLENWNELKSNFEVKTTIKKSGSCWPDFFSSILAAYIYQKCIYYPQNFPKSFKVQASKFSPLWAQKRLRDHAAKSCHTLLAWPWLLHAAWAWVLEKIEVPAPKPLQTLVSALGGLIWAILELFERGWDAPWGCCFCGCATAPLHFWPFVFFRLLLLFACMPNWAWWGGWYVLGWGSGVGHGFSLRFRFVVAVWLFSLFLRIFRVGVAPAGALINFWSAIRVSSHDQSEVSDPSLKILANKRTYTYVHVRTASGQNNWENASLIIVIVVIITLRSKYRCVGHWLKRNLPVEKSTRSHFGSNHFGIRISSCLLEPPIWHARHLA